MIVILLLCCEAFVLQNNINNKNKQVLALVPTRITIPTASVNPVASPCLWLFHSSSVASAFSVPAKLLILSPFPLKAYPLFGRVVLVTFSLWSIRCWCSSSLCTCCVQCSSTFFCWCWCSCSRAHLLLLLSFDYQVWLEKSTKQASDWLHLAAAAS